MPDSIDELLRHKNVTLGQPAPDLAIAALKNHLGSELPDALLRIWRAGDNIQMPALNAEIVSPEKALWMLSDTPVGPVLLKRGFLPIVDDHQSNYLAVLVYPPLAYRIAHLPHDDGSRLVYRELNSLAEAD